MDGPYVHNKEIEREITEVTRSSQRILKYFNDQLKRLGLILLLTKSKYRVHQIKVRVWSFCNLNQNILSVWRHQFPSRHGGSESYKRWHRLSIKVRFILNSQNMLVSQETNYLFKMGWKYYLWSIIDFSKLFQCCLLTI